LGSGSESDIDEKVENVVKNENEIIASIPEVDQDQNLPHTSDNKEVSLVKSDTIRGAEYIEESKGSDKDDENLSANIQVKEDDND
jgi:hypothetical protein